MNTPLPHSQPYKENPQYGHKHSSMCFWEKSATLHIQPQTRSCTRSLWGLYNLSVHRTSAALINQANSTFQVRFAFRSFIVCLLTDKNAISCVTLTDQYQQPAQNKHVFFFFSWLIGEECQIEPEHQRVGGSSDYVREEYDLFPRKARPSQVNRLTIWPAGGTRPARLFHAAR